MKSRGILIISLHADPTTPSGVGEGGGTHAYLRELVSGLALRGRYSAIVTRRATSNSEATVCLCSRSMLYRIDVGPPGPLAKTRLDDYHHDALAAVERTLPQLEFCPEIVHSVYWNSGRVAMELSRKLAIPYVHTVISNGFRRRIEGADNSAPSREKVESEVFCNAFRIFAVSLEERRDLVQHYGVDSERIVVVGRIVDEAFLVPPHDENGTPRPVSVRDTFGRQ